MGKKNSSSGTYRIWKWTDVLLKKANFFNNFRLHPGSITTLTLERPLEASCRVLSILLQRSPRSTWQSSTIYCLPLHSFPDHLSLNISPKELHQQVENWPSFPNSSFLSLSWAHSLTELSLSYHDCIISIRVSSDELHQSLIKFYSLVISHTPPLFQ